MEFSMVNSSSFGSERNGNTKASCIQANSLHDKTQSSSPLTASSATQSKNDFPDTADSSELCETQAVEPTPSQTDFDGRKAVSYDSFVLSDKLNDMEIEYGSKPSKKKTQMKKDEVHYKYFTRRKYQASILEHKENRDLSKLDMWTQYIIKNRQQKVLDDKKSPKEILDYFSGEEYKNIMKREELNRILDRRGPFEDLREEVSKKAALDKLNGENHPNDDDSFAEIGELLNEMLNKVFELAKDSCPSVPNFTKNVTHFGENNISEIPSYLNLKPNTGLTTEGEIDRSDKIALICSSQETENFELPSNTVRGKNEKVELTGEWARSRIYVCAACGLKLQNIKQFLEHKSASHQYIWVQHYEFVGNQSELYRHLSIPILGKVGVLENVVQCKVWKRSDSRLCTKCGKQCNSLGELHRHILECGGDWTWMLARKKCKYRPFGAKSRRKRRGLVKRIYTQKTEPSEKKVYKKNFDVPRQKPSDADTIKRMLANLPAKRATRKIISLKDGFNTPRKKQVKTTKTSKFKCGKLIHGKAKEQNKVAKSEYKKTNKNQNNNHRRSLRCLNKVLTSRILDTNSSLIMRRKYNTKKGSKEIDNVNVHTNQIDVNEKCQEQPAKFPIRKVTKTSSSTSVHIVDEKQAKEEFKSKRSSPRIEKRLEFSSTIDRVNIKRFFPVKKKKNFNQVDTAKNVHVTKLNAKRKNTKVDESSQKNPLKKNVKPNSQKIKNGQFGGVNKTFSLRKRKFDFNNVNSDKPDKPKIKRNLTAGKTRKLRNNLRSVVDEFDTLTSYANEPSKPSDNYTQTEINSFFERIEPETKRNPLELIKVSENTTNFEKVEADEVENDTNLQRDTSDVEKSATVETNDNAVSVVPKSSYPNKTKRKLRKPARGLNDCIAMLTNKLGKNFEKPTESNIFYEMSNKNCQENLASEENERPEYILKVPFSNEHFELHSKIKENERLENLEHSPGKYANVTRQAVEDIVETKSTLETSNGSDNETENQIKCDKLNEETNEPHTFLLRSEEMGDELKDNLTAEELVPSIAFSQPDECYELKNEEILENCEINTTKSVTNAESMFLECVSDIELLVDNGNRSDKANDDTDSEDEVPLATFLKEEQFSRNTPCNMKNVLEHNTDLNAIVEEAATVQVSADAAKNQQVSCVEVDPDKCNIKCSDVFIEENHDEKDILDCTASVALFDEKITVEETVLIEEQNSSVKLNVDDENELRRVKDPSVLMEINDNLHSKNESLNCHSSSVVEISLDVRQLKKQNDNKLNDLVLAPAETILQNADIESVVHLCKINSANNVMKQGSDLLVLEEQCDNLVTPKLDNSTKNVNIVDKEELNDNIEPNVVEDISSDYKENSRSIAEEPLPKYKAKRKSMNKNKLAEYNGNRNAKESEEYQRANSNKKSVRNAKAKALESILDEAILELTENEFLQENFKNTAIDNVELVCQKTELLKNSLNKPKLVVNSFNEVVVNESNSFQENSDLKSAQEDPGQESVEDSSTSNLFHVNNEQTVNESKNNPNTDSESVKELRRSRRNSRKVTSYNEIDLVDPLFDDIDSDKTISKILKETTKDIFAKRKSRKLFHQKKMPKNGSNDKKLTGDELFDLLKSTPSENIVLSKPPHTFFNNFEEISDDFNDDNFDVFGDILEKSMAVIEENLSERAIPSLVESLPNSINKEPEESHSNFLSDPKIKISSLEQNNKRRLSRKKSKKSKHKHKNKEVNIQIKNNATSNGEVILNEERNSIPLSDVENTINSEPVNNCDTSSLQSSQVDSIKNNENDKNKVVYCEICDKSFCRMESLTKHKRTLTHISKLSELEAKEAALKSNCDEINRNEETEVTRMSSSSGKNSDVLRILEDVDTEECKQFSSPFTVSVNNANLKLADIISDVLNKPILKKNDESNNFTEIIMHANHEVQPEMPRLKSLAERKSFESDNCLGTAKTVSHVKPVDYFESENVAAGTILQKQITLLENIIENRSRLSYIDELSVSSTNSVNENVCSENGLNVNTAKQSDLIDTYSDKCRQENNAIRSNIEESFLKPSQYEEISEDSNLRNYDEQKSRKALNRDEELFLECCSLLKSGSEVSSYSKKSNNVCKDLNNIELKPCEEPDWLETNGLLPKQNRDFVDSCSDNSRIRTPLGDSFSQDDSNTAISSHWDMNSSNTISNKKSWKKSFSLDDKNFTFEQVFSNSENKKDIFCSKKEVKNLRTVVSSFDHVITEVLKNELSTSNEDVKKRNRADLDEVTNQNETRNYKTAPAADGKKVLTKGAMKIFEGLKVSIPTEELNIDKILTCGHSVKATNLDSSDFTGLTLEKEKNGKQLRDVRCNSELHGKSSSKQKNATKSKQNKWSLSSKIHDIYDFEETQDNSDVFTKPDFRSFRNNHEKSKKNEKPEGSDDDSQDCTDAISFDAFSSSTSSVSELLPTKSNTQQNITKKKCMIMGRIFKNAVKSRVIDEDIRNIPIIDNAKLVEDFVLNCPEPVTEKKTKMTEEEMNLAFDNLVNSKSNESKQTATKSCPPVSDKLEHKNSLGKRKSKVKSKKRSYGCSDTSDDEFKLQKSSKKRPKKKNNKIEDNCINLEQELRECIGVASRKSQRKCTSGKQNVLIEYWSSDESSFETLPEPPTSKPSPTNYTVSEEAVDKLLPDTTVTEIDRGSDEGVNHEDNNKVVDAQSHKRSRASPSTYIVNRRKRAAANPLYHWSSSSEDESRDLIEVRPIRDEIEDDEDRPVQHGWIVGDSPKKLVTMLAQAKGKKCETDSVKEHGKKRTSTFS
ncbi:hypothetical protein MTP99_010987 [Tenebrio molitor]|nr:hypothetical protein MTP99_010987 [Tenebrio molitor]